jgi:hypothetical protein
MGDEKYSLETRVNSGNRRQKHALILAPDIEARHIKNIYQGILTFLNLDYQDIHVVMKPLYSIMHAVPSSGEKAIMINDHKVILYPNKVESVTNAINNLSQEAKNEDIITVYSTGHGTYIGPAYSSLLFGNEKLNPFTMRRELQTHMKDNASHIFIADQCLGLDFIWPMVKQSNGIGIAANKSGKSSHEENFPLTFFPNLRKTKNLKKAFDCVYIQNTKKSSYLSRQEPQMIEVVDGKLRAYPDDSSTIGSTAAEEDNPLTPLNYDVPMEHFFLSDAKRLEALLNPGVKPRII